MRAAKCLPTHAPHAAASLRENPTWQRPHLVPAVVQVDNELQPCHLRHRHRASNPPRPSRRSVSVCCPPPPAFSPRVLPRCSPAVFLHSCLLFSLTLPFDSRCGYTYSCAQENWIQEQKHGNLKREQENAIKRKQVATRQGEMSKGRRAKGKK